MRIGRTAVYNHLIEQCDFDGAHIEGLYDIYNLVNENVFEVDDAEDEERVEPEDYTLAKKVGEHIYKIAG